MLQRERLSVIPQEPARVYLNHAVSAWDAVRVEADSDPEFAHSSGLHRDVQHNNMPCCGLTAKSVCLRSLVWSILMHTRLNTNGDGLFRAIKKRMAGQRFDIGDAGGFINQSLVFFSPACS
jgi:hypothetical protein